MEGLMRKKICDHHHQDDTAPSSVSMHKKSQTISKMKSKIRIIHIFAPEIIKTDAANFRELVQRLTGKPTTDEQNCGKRERRRVERGQGPRIFGKMEEVAMRPGGVHAAAEAEAEGFRVRVKEEGEEIWRDANSGGGFLGGFSEFDHFPFMEGTTQMDAYEQPQLAN